MRRRFIHHVALTLGLGQKFRNLELDGAKWDVNQILVIGGNERDALVAFRQEALS